MTLAANPHVLAESLFAPAGALGDSAELILHAAREHLGMDVAFISEFLGDGTRIFHYVDARDPGHNPITPGMKLPLEEGYCLRVIEGTLPELIPDTSLLPAAMGISATLEIPIGAHLSVPIRLRDGTVYGTFCCFSFRADRSLNARDLGMMHTLSALVGRQIDYEMDKRFVRSESVRRIEGVIAAGQPELAYQPIYHLAPEWRISGVELLSRFRCEPARSPDQWFAEAASVDLGPRLELSVIRRGLAELRRLPGSFYVSVNVSPATLLSDALTDTLGDFPADRLVLEVTEHARVDDYEAIAAVLGPLRQAGVRLAIDDAGAGYASMKHILTLHPDLIKLDIGIVRGIDRDWGRNALASALVRFAASTGCLIVAEGIETAGELSTLHRMGVTKGQGFFMNKPMPLADFRDVLDEESARQASMPR